MRAGRVIERFDAKQAHTTTDIKIILYTRRALFAVDARKIRRAALSSRVRVRQK